MSLEEFKSYYRHRLESWEGLKAFAKVLTEFRQHIHPYSQTHTETIIQINMVNRLVHRNLNGTKSENENDEKINMIIRSMIHLINRLKEEHYKEHSKQHL